MTLFDVEELMAYWADHPPVHILLAALLGIERDARKAVPAPRAIFPPDREGSPEPNRETAALAPAQEMLAALGPGFRAGAVHAGLGSAVLDFTELRRHHCAESRDRGF